LWQDSTDLIIADAFDQAILQMDNPGTPLVECEVSACDAFNDVVEPILDALPEGCEP
jgi:hypothetical protein